MPRVASRTVDDVRRALAPTDELGESPLWPASALVGAAGLYADLPSQFIAGAGGGAFGIARWLVPALTVLVLIALGVIRRPGRSTRVSTGAQTSSPDAPSPRARVDRACQRCELGVDHPPHPPARERRVHERDAASVLLRAALHMWGVNVLLFGLWFWQLDGGGPGRRPTCLPPSATFSSRSRPSPRSPSRAGGRSSSTTSTSPSRTPRRSARPTRCP